MKIIQHKLMILILVALAFPFMGYSQGDAAIDFGYEMKKIEPFISISEEKLKDAGTIQDLNRRYKSFWVKEYISVEIEVSIKGKIRKANSKNHILSKEQKKVMKMADKGTDITVSIKYIPENNLKENDVKENFFIFKIDPEKDATFVGGQQVLKEYLKDNAIDKIPAGSFKNHEIAAVKFTVSEEGEVIDAHIFQSVYQSYDNKQVDELLLQAIQKMPCWKPAEYANGTKVKQNFVFTVGNMESCLVNLIDVDF